MMVAERDWWAPGTVVQSSLWHNRCRSGQIQVCFVSDLYIFDDLGQTEEIAVVIFSFCKITNNSSSSNTGFWIRRPNIVALQRDTLVRSLQYPHCLQTLEAHSHNSRNILWMGSSRIFATRSEECVSIFQQVHIKGIVVLQPKLPGMRGISKAD